MGDHRRTSDLRCSDGVREGSQDENQEIIRRWQAGSSLRQIAASTGLSRDTVTRYVAAARAEGIAQGGPVATEEQLSRLAATDQVRPGVSR